MEFSWFPGFYSNIAQKCHVEDWAEFVNTLRVMSGIPGYKPAMGDFDREQPLISPAIYGDDTKRLNDNTTAWDFIMLDIDDGIESIDQVTEHFKLFQHVIYSTANCTSDKLKIRVCVPLNTRAPKDQLHGIWHALNEWCAGILDKQTKDKSRMHYIPAMYTNKGTEYNHLFIENDGIDLNWQGLVAKYPAPPEKDKFQINNPLKGLKRKIFVDNNPLPSLIITEHDCPFVYDKMVEDYRMTPAGGHHNAIYTFLVKCCYQALKISYPITVDELADMGRQIDDLDGGFYPDSKIMGSARDAIEYTGA